MIGRNEEIIILNKLYNSGRAELVAVYGRRRVGNVSRRSSNCLKNIFFLNFQSRIRSE